MGCALTGSIHEALDALCEECDAEQLHAELTDFLGDLWVNDLIQVEADGSGEEEEVTAAEVVAVR